MKNKKLYIIFVLLLFCSLTGCEQSKTLTFQGYVDSPLVYIASSYAGQLDRLNVKDGQKIKKGDLLFQLDPEPEKTQLAEAQQRLSQAQANLDNLIKGQRETVLAGIEAQIKQTLADVKLAEVRVARYRTLAAKNYASKDTLDAEVANLKSRQELLKQYQANLAEAKLGGRTDLIIAQQATIKEAQATVARSIWSLDQKKQTAPWNGIVYDTLVRQGDWIAAGKPVVALLNPTYTQAIFFVPEPMLGKIKLGTPVEISCDDCKRSYPGKITYISPEAEYTPPVIYSRENNYKLVYRIKADPDIQYATDLHDGQPVYVTIKETL